MNNTIDLQLTDEISPLFDHTLNTFSRDHLQDILKTPLKDTDSIQKRQDILQSLIQHKDVCFAYHYSNIDFHDAHTLLYSPDLHKYSNTLQYYSSKSLRNSANGNFIQLTLFLRKVETALFEALPTVAFPEHYQEDWLSMKYFLLKFKLEKHAQAIKKRKFGLSNIRELAHLISISRQDEELNHFFEHFFRLETYISIASGITKHKFTFPNVGTKHLDIKGMYHPALQNPVKNDFYTEKNVVLITGANMSGKSTLLKTIGLAIYLSHLGLAIPALSASLPLFQNMSVVIDHNDDMKNGYSHFMNEIQKLKSILTKAQERQSCFAVFDELFKGTNIEDAQQITAVSIAGLTQFKNSLFFISTHLHELRELEAIKEGIVDCYYIDCALNKDNLPAFTYKVKSGWSDLKIGQILFANEGLYDLLTQKKKD